MHVEDSLGLHTLQQPSNSLGYYKNCTLGPLKTPLVSRDIALVTPLVTRHVCTLGTLKTLAWPLENVLP